MAVGAILGAYIIVYGQCQSWRAAALARTPTLTLTPTLTPTLTVTVTLTLTLTLTLARTPQLVLQPLGQGPPNKQTEILWGVINCMPTAVMAAVCYGCPNSSPNPNSNPNPNPNSNPTLP